MGPGLPQSIPVVIETGLSTYKFLFSGRVDGAAIKNAVSGAILARPCEMGLFHRGCLIDDDRDRRGLSTSWDNELRLRLEVTIFIPK